MALIMDRSFSTRTKLLSATRYLRRNDQFIIYRVIIKKVCNEECLTIL